jgi:LPS sulfotransferase NodH
MVKKSKIRGAEFQRRRTAPPHLFGPTDDRSWPGRAVGTVVIASEPRSGSTLLAEALADSGFFGIPHEYLIYPEIGRARRDLGIPRPTLSQRWRMPVRRILGRPDWWALYDFRPDDLPRLVDEIVHRRTAANGMFALKIHWRTYSMMSQRFGFDFDMLPQPIRWVHLERADVVAQSVSFVKAQQTGVFGVRGPASTAIPSDPTYDDDVLVGAYVKMMAGREGWRTFFSDCGADTISVGYEELRDNYAATVNRVAASLGWPLDRVPDPRLRRQADALSEEWAERFRERHAHLVSDSQGP